MNAAQRQVAADPWTKPLGLSHKLTYREVNIIAQSADRRGHCPIS